MSCRATRCSPSIQKYLGITLLPQAGVALGMAAEAAELSDGHIIPEGRTSARTANKPEVPVSLD